MTHPLLLATLAVERADALRTEAGLRRIAAIATCCRPSSLVRAVDSVRSRLTRATACCA